MAKKNSAVKQVSFKKDEVYLLEILEERYKPFSFSNYVKQLIVRDIGTGKKHYESTIPGPIIKPCTNTNDYQIEAERDELEL